VIKDTQGRKWFMRFRQYRNGWHWEARHENLGQEGGMFETKALAEADAYDVIRSRDAVAGMQEFFRRLRQRGTPCQLTSEDREAIARAGASQPTS